MMRKVRIRVDGSTEIGLGHIVRCIALANMVRNDFAVLFFCKQIPGTVRKDIERNRFPVNMIESEAQFIADTQTNDIVVLDGYKFDLAYQQEIKNKGVCLICIDDLHNQEFVADMIINHAPGISKEQYVAPTYTQFALGIEYALLRPAFLEQARKEKSAHNLERVLICFGGSDAKNLTQVALKAVREGVNIFKKIIIVTGPAYNNQEGLLNAINGDATIEYHHAISEEEMRSLMISSDLAILPASGILFEALASGLMIISGYYIGNQINIYNGFLDLSAIIDAKDFSEKSLQHALQIVNGEVSTSKIIDGLSGERLRTKIKNLANVYSIVS